MNAPRHRHSIGISRREALQVGYTGLLGIGLTSALTVRTSPSSASAMKRRKPKSVILVYLSGGFSHIDTFDMKPNAPAFEMDRKPAVLRERYGCHGFGNALSPARRFRTFVGLILAAFSLAALPCSGTAAEKQRLDDRRDLREAALPLLQTYCVGCHGPKKQKAELRLDAQSGDLLKIATWKAILEKLETGEMPPKKAPHPKPEQLALVVRWLRTELKAAGQALDSSEMAFPIKGNYVDHDQLFNQPSKAFPATPARVWRRSPAQYLAFMDSLTGGPLNLDIPTGSGGPEGYWRRALIVPYGLASDPGFRDYAFRYKVSGSETLQLAMNAKLVLQAMMSNDRDSGIPKLMGRRNWKPSKELSIIAGDTFNYTITTTNKPTNFNATGLPTGLSINTSNGVICGTPTAMGTYRVTLSARNAAGTGTAILSVRINSPAAPVITSPVTANGIVGTAFSYKINAIHGPTGFNATGLPAGLSLNTTTGVISGTSTVAGTFSVTLNATNNEGTGIATVSLTINPVITSPPTASGTVGTAFSYKIAAAPNPTGFNATGLPAGLSVDTKTGVISGTPTAAGTSSVTLNATNAAGTWTARLSLTINRAITSPMTANGGVGTAFNYTIAASNNPKSFKATGLPAGLVLNPKTGVISGTPTVAGIFSVTLSATNAAGTRTATSTLSLTIGPAGAPVINCLLNVSGTVGALGAGEDGLRVSDIRSLDRITATNRPTSFTATGLPPGISLDTKTGTISGNPTVAGTYSALLSASNVAGTGYATLSVTVRPGQSAPIITSPLSASGTVAIPPSAEQVQAAVSYLFQQALYREPTVAEMKRFAGFVTAGIERYGNHAGLVHGLVPVLLHPEAIFRTELGQGKPDEHGRVMLSPAELAVAISYALTDMPPNTTSEHKYVNGSFAFLNYALHHDDALLAAARNGELATRADVRREVTRLLDDPKIEKPRILRFFQEYFDYYRAPEVFKDAPTDFGAGFKARRPDGNSYAGYAGVYAGAARVLVHDTDRLVEDVLRKDRDVLRELLTTDKTYALADQIGERDFARGRTSDHPFAPGFPYYKFYNLDPKKWSTEGAPPEYDDRFPYAKESNDPTKWASGTPITLPSDQRLGILTQPAWLIAHSSNFDNHAIRRGKWVRERLLGGHIPDVPITVDAKLPDEPKETLRHRMRVTRVEYCYKCHVSMDPLGLPFEFYDHFGQFRATEQGKPVDASGEVIDSGDPKIDGKVGNALELIRKLADSEQVQQVFVRHAFRYWMGRNETLDDAPTLQAAYKAYKESGGSMKALITSLLTSDSFLYRR